MTPPVPIIGYIAKFIPVKIHKTVDTRAAHFGSDMHEIVCRLGLRRRPHWGSLQRPPPDPLAALRGPTSKGWGGEGWGGERKGWEGREGRGQAPQNSGSRTAPAGHWTLWIVICIAG